MAWIVFKMRGEGLECICVLTQSARGVGWDLLARVWGGDGLSAGEVCAWQVEVGPFAQVAWWPSARGREQEWEWLRRRQIGQTEAPASVSLTVEQEGNTY